jgi:hypothetical protein
MARPTSFPVQHHNSFRYRGVPRSSTASHFGRRARRAAQSPAGGRRSSVTIRTTLQQEALEWTWDTIGATEIDRWVAEELTGYAEEVHKLVIALDHHRMLAAAVQRSILALRLGIIMGVHHRLLYESENVLWGLVNQIMGSDWAQAQSAALGLDGESLRTSCLAALDLFVIAAGTVRGHLDARQLAVVQHALALIDRVRIAPNSSGRGGSLENPMP